MICFEVNIMENSEEKQEEGYVPTLLVIYQIICIYRGGL